MNDRAALGQDLGSLRALLQNGRVGFFCDFDGTISEKDMIGTLLMEFAPDEARPIIQQIKRRERSVQDGVSALFQLLPADRFGEIERYALTATRLRSGFFEFVSLCEARGWSFTVVSGGMDFFVKPALGPVAQSAKVYCNEIVTTGDRLDVRWPYVCDADCDGGCGLCKPGIVRSVRDQLDAVIVIGDGVTDFKVAAIADFVFARDTLLELCVEHGFAHAAFETFDDIMDTIRRATS